MFVNKKPNQLRSELDQLIADGGGYVSAPRVVEWAREHPDSKLHAVLEWDDSIAGHKYRLQQARQLIRVHVEVVAETGHKTRAFVSLQHHRIPDEGYRTLEAVLDDPIERRILLDQARRELQRWREKYEVLIELKEIIAAIEKGLEGETEAA